MAANSVVTMPDISTRIATNAGKNTNSADTVAWSLAAASMES